MIVLLFFFSIAQTGTESKCDYRNVYSWALGTQSVKLFQKYKQERNDFLHWLQLQSQSECVYDCLSLLY